MSKILRRPMFRGGPVDSRGTGITSGLGYEAGGRVGYEKVDLVLGGDLYTKDDFSNFINNYRDNLNKNSALYKSIFTTTICCKMDGRYTTSQDKPILLKNRPSNNN